MLECWDRKHKSYVAIKIVRNVQKYRDAAMIEVGLPGSVRMHVQISAEALPRPYRRPASLKRNRSPAHSQEAAAADARWHSQRAQQQQQPPKTYFSFRHRSRVHEQG